MNPLRLCVLLMLMVAACAGPKAAAWKPPPPPPIPPTPMFDAQVVPKELPRGSGPWWNGAVFYQIFVRSFKDSNGDGKGDLKGIIEKLDYLNDGNPQTHSDLGVDALWLTPIFESPSYHGYDTVNYERIKEEYGTEADFELLLKEAHKRGIKVFLDLVLNHTSNQHPWFVEASTSADSKKRDWYLWSKTNPGWTQPWNPGASAWHRKGDDWYYGIFWFGMPDLNLKNPKVREEMTRIATLWEKKGVDGYRLDAVRHFIETGPGRGQVGSDDNHVFLKQFITSLRKVNPQIALVGEVWSGTTDIASYFGDGNNEVQMLFDFPLAATMVNSALAGDATNIVDQLQDELKLYPKGAVNAPFLSNHDQIRVATTLNKDRSKLGLSAAMLLSLPGAPFIYYGEEIGMANGPGTDDEFKRTPMMWTEGPANVGFSSATRPWQHTASIQWTTPVAAQIDDPHSLLSRYRALIRARHASPALAMGALTLLDPGNSKVLAFLRQEGDEQVLVAHNLSIKPLTVSVKVKAVATEPLFVDERAVALVADDGLKLTIPAYGSGIWRLKAAP